MVQDDFTTWSESDPSSRISRTASRITWTNLNRTDVDTYAYKDKTGELQNFTRFFALRITAIQSASQTIRANPFMVSERLDDYTDTRAGNYESFGLMIRSLSSAATYSLIVVETYNGTAYVVDMANNLLNVGTTYYCKVVKSGTSFTLYVYTDPTFTTEEPDYAGGKTLVLHGDWNLQYMLIPQSIHLSNSVTISGYIENLKDSLLESGSGNLPAVFTLRQGEEDLLGSLIVKNASNRSLKNIFIVRHSSSKGLYAQFSSQAVKNLHASFLLRSEYEGLPAEFFVPFPFKDLSAETVIRHTASPKNLKTLFIVRRSVPDWRTHEAFIDDITPWHITWTEDPVGLPMQRKAFRAKGRLWITYHSDNRLWFKTSLDGRIWSAAQTFREEGDEHSGEYFAVWFDGQYIHYAYGGGYSEPCFYRRGEPQSDGSITWSGPEVIAKALSVTDSYHYPNIGVDKDGYPFISYSFVDSSVFRDPYVLRSSRNDGTWATAETHTLTTADGAYYTSCIPLPNGMLVFYTRYTVDVPSRAKEWNGSSWADKDPNGGPYFTALADSVETVHLAYLDQDGKIYYMYFSGGSWSGAIEIASSGSWPVLVLDYDETLWVLWEEDDNIHCLHKNKAGLWSEEIIYEQSHGVIRFAQTSAPLNAGLGKNGFMQGTQIPFFFHVSGIEKFYVLTIEYLAPELKGVFNVGQDSVALKAEFRVTAEVLPAEAIIRHSSSFEISAEFILRQLGTTDLLGYAELIPVRDLYVRFRVRQQYDITGWKGISFLWYGGGGWDQLVEFEIHSPTGFWRAEFYDGPAEYRFVFIPLSDFTELGLDGTRPDPSEIIAFLWTYHTQGIRKVSDLAVWYTAVPDLPAEMKIRRPASETLFAKFILA